MIIQASTKKKRRQLPLKLRQGGKTDVRTQFAALCFRFNGADLEICIVTSRKSKRWILPKGWPMHNQTPAQAAATEAWEEAGVRGQAIDHCLGAYSYTKPLSKNPTPVVVMIYPVAVKEVSDCWPEQHDRKRKWVVQRKAAKKLQEPELRRIVATFDPARLVG